MHKNGLCVCLWITDELSFVTPSKSQQKWQCTIAFELYEKPHLAYSSVASEEDRTLHRQKFLHQVSVADSVSGGNQYFKKRLFFVIFKWWEYRRPWCQTLLVKVHVHVPQSVTLWKLYRTEECKWINILYSTHTWNKSLWNVCKILRNLTLWKIIAFCCWLLLIVLVRHLTCIWITYLEDCEMVQVAVHINSPFSHLLNPISAKWAKHTELLSPSVRQSFNHLPLLPQKSNLSNN